MRAHGEARALLHDILLVMLLAPDAPMLLRRKIVSRTLLSLRAYAAADMPRAATMFSCHAIVAPCEIGAYFMRAADAVITLMPFQLIRHAVDRLISSRGGADATPPPPSYLRDILSPSLRLFHAF